MPHMNKSLACIKKTFFSGVFHRDSDYQHL